MRKWLRLCLLAAWCAVAGRAVDWKALRPQGHVNDFAGVIDPGSRSQLDAWCGKVQQASGVDIRLVVLASLEREPVKGVAKALFEAWAGTGKDARVMLLLTVADRRSYVAVGGGVAPRIASGLQARILREISPALRQRDYNEALRAAADTAGSAALAGTRAAIPRLPRRLRWTLTGAIPWGMLAGGIAVAALLVWAGTPLGYAPAGARAWWRRTMCRSTWGSRGSGGFGSYDSGDSFGGFGGGSCNDW